MITRLMERMALLLGLGIFVALSATRSLAAAPATQPSDTRSAEQLAQSRDMVQRVLNNWDFLTWDQVLAKDVQVELKLGTLTVASDNTPAAIGTDLQVSGRDDAKKALKQIYGDLKKNVKIVGQVAYGNEVILIGDLNVTDKSGKPEALPIACYMRFNPQGKIEQLTLASIDTRPLIEAANKGEAQPASGKQ
jgi:hypothetical protein